MIGMQLAQGRDDVPSTLLVHAVTGGTQPRRLNASRCNHFTMCARLHPQCSHNHHLFMLPPCRHVLVLGGGDHIVRVYDPVGDVVHPLPRVRCPFPDVTAVLPLPEDPGSYFLVLGRDQQAVRWRLLGPGASAHSAPVAGPRTLELDPLGTGKAQGVATLTASAYLSLDLPPIASRFC